MNYIPKEAYYNISQPMPRHDFSAFDGHELSKTQGLVAATQRQLEEQIKSKMRLDPNAKEIRYFYYEVVSDTK